MDALRTAYETTVLPHGVGTDSALWSGLADGLAKEFSRLTRTVVPGVTLLAIAEEKRKRGEWFKVGRGGHGHSGFDDLDQAANM